MTLSLIAAEDTQRLFSKIFSDRSNIKKIFIYHKIIQSSSGGSGDTSGSSGSSGSFRFYKLKILKILFSFNVFQKFLLLFIFLQLNFNFNTCTLLHLVQFIFYIDKLTWTDFLYTAAATAVNEFHKVLSLLFACTMDPSTFSNFCSLFHKTLHCLLR